MAVLIGCVLNTPVVADPALVQQPQLQVKTLDGSEFELSKQRGKWVIINFWATWCSPCIKEMPDISQFVTKHTNVIAIGLAYEDTEKSEIEAFLKAHPVQYPIAQIDTYKPPKDFEVPRGLPLTYVIAPDGRVAKCFVGPVTASDLEQAISPMTP